MKRLLVLGVLSITLGCAPNPKETDLKGHGNHEQNHGHHHGGQGHGHGPQAGADLIVVATDPPNPVSGRPVTLRLMIHAADGAMVKDFQVMHEEKVHLVIVREGLDHFAHIHPAVDAKGNLTVTHTFPAGGKYWLFADYKPASGEHATATGSLTLGGDSPPASRLNPDAPGEVVADGLRTTVSEASLRAGTPGPGHLRSAGRKGWAGPPGTLQGATGAPDVRQRRHREIRPLPPGRRRRSPGLDRVRGPLPGVGTLQGLGAVQAR